MWIAPKDGRRESCLTAFGQEGLAGVTRLMVGVSLRLHRHTIIFPWQLV